MYKSRFSALRFRRPEPVLLEKAIKMAAVDPAAPPAAEAVEPESLPEAIELFGLPSDPDAKSARDEAVSLLRIAAEIEHALLVEYLYAAYSVKDPADNWSQTLVKIAKQEMAHLISVQNLLLFVKGEPHFLREDFAMHPTVFPFPFRLEPLSLASLAKYVSAEAPPPDQIPAAQRAKVQAIRDQAKQELGSSVHLVGLIYAKLYLLFQKDDQPAGPWQIELPPGQPPVWHIADSDFGNPADVKPQLATQNTWAPGLRNPSDGGMHVDDDTGDPSAPGKSLRDAALESIAFIAAQGEGPVAQDDCHFENFFRIYQDFEAAGAAAAARVLPVATNPSLTGGPGLITDATTKQWAALFNSIYQLLVLELIRAMSKPEAARGDLVGTAEESDMMPNLKFLALLLATKPLGAAPGQNSGAPFELDAANIPSDVSAIPAAMSKRIADALAAIASLGTSPDFDLPGLGDDLQGRDPNA